MIMKLLSQSRAPLRFSEIAEVLEKELSINRRTVQRALGRLAQAGKIQKPRQGYYEIRNNAALDNWTGETDIYSGELSKSPKSLPLSENNTQLLHDYPEFLK
jgi:DNA-binding transcriptional ArsR family regulator